MANDKPFFPNENSKYGEGVILDEYNGSFSLVSARKKDDEVYMEWVYPQARDGSRKPIDKNIPLKITFGDRESIIKGLRFFLAELGASEQVGPAPGEPDVDIPF
jgi:hypothetical protein